MENPLQRIEKIGLNALARTGSTLHALLLARATAAHPWLFAAPATTRRPGVLPAETAPGAAQGSALEKRDGRDGGTG